jgi:serine/threonine-protein kinase
VHRDIKPSNVILVDARDDDGNPVQVAKVCDFGIALDAGDADTGLARVVGTPEYMSPEQCRGVEVDGRSDVYSCAIMLYELVTGQLPFQGRDEKDYLRLHELAAPTPPSTFVSDIDPLLEGVLLKALSKAPAARFQSMRDFRNALKELLEPPIVPVPPPQPEQPVQPGRDDEPSIPSISIPSISIVSSPAIIMRSPIANVPSPLGAEPVSATNGHAVVGTPMHALMGALSDWVQAAYEPKEAPSAPAPVDLATEIAQAPETRLAQIAKLRASPEFAKETELLESAVRALAARGDANALGHVVRVMAAVYEEAARTGATAAWAQNAGACASRVLHTVADPNTLTPLSERVLAGSSDPGEAEVSLLTWARVAGAHALFAARMKNGAPEARKRFVAAMRLFGAAASPVIRAALERLLGAAGGAPISDPPLVLDLLLSVPSARDDALGSIISRCVLSSEPGTARAAIGALVSTWGDRATPVLVASLQNPDEGVRAAALIGLRTVSAVDEFVVRKIGAMVTSGSASEALALAAADALSQSNAAARPLALSLVLGVVARETGAQPTVSAMVAYARAALALGSEEARATIETRARQSKEPLKGSLLALLTP